ncbi:zinc ribbon domain-containing protein [Maribacter sp. IgM3_T14_3]|uniref:zinc ribbon domain-containing protein n=1 Tax=Maribacter sp. IgM3_T14_3 TaxID=3415140 RepID=UPI003C6EEFF0
MALIKCVECNSEISDKAVFCPNCGYTKNQDTRPVQREGCFLQTLNGGCMAIVIILIILGIFVQLGPYFLKLINYLYQASQSN